MDKKSKNTLIISIIALALVLIGVTYAYFSARITGLESASTISLTAGRMGIVFSEGSEDFEASNIYPREEAWITKTFTLTGYNTTDQEMNYYAGFMVINNTFPNTYLTYDLRVLEATSGTPIVEKTGVQINGTGYIRFGKGTFRGANGDHHSYEVKIYFKDNGKDQNDGQDKVFNGKLYVTPGVPQNEYTVYEGVQKLKTYDINYDNCMNYVNDESQFGYSYPENMDPYCRGEKIRNEETESIANIIAGGGGDELESLGMIQNVVRDGNNEITNYTINYSNCMNNINRDYMFNNADASTICNGGEAYYSYSIEREVLSGNYDYLIGNNIIKNVVRNNNDEITSYDIDYNNCMASFEYNYTPEDEKESYCTGGDAYDTKSLDADIKESRTLQEYIEQNVIENMTYETVPELKKFYSGDTVEVGQYTYTFKSNLNGWRVVLTDKESTDPVTTKLYTSINGYPIVDMQNTFGDSYASSIDLSSFDTSNVTNMQYMFSNTQVSSLDLSSFDTSNVTNMSNMFYNSMVNNLNLRSFDTSNVTSMYNMFYKSQATTLDLSSFDTSNVTDMRSMFYDSSADKIDISNFDTSKVTNMNSMFSNAQATVINISNINTSNVIDMSYMFEYTNATSIDVSNLDFKNATLRQMFDHSNVEHLDFSNKDFSTVTSIYDFLSSSNIKTLSFKNANLSNITTINKMFRNCQSLETIDFSGANLSSVTSLSSTFSSRTDSDQEYIGNYSLLSLKKVDFSNADLSSVKYMGWMFNGRGKLEEVSFANATMPLVESMPNMFEYDHIKTIDFRGVNFTNLTDLNNMFCSVTTDTLNIPGLDTSKVTNMSSMFKNAKINKLDLSSFNTSSVTSMGGMFYTAEIGELNLSGFDTSNVTNMSYMFSNSKINEIDLSSFDMSNVTTKNSMFTSTSATIGYARTQADADILNATSKPSALVFVVKN